MSFQDSKLIFFVEGGAEWAGHGGRSKMKHPQVRVNKALCQA